MGFKHHFSIHRYVHGVVTPLIETRTKATLNLYRKPGCILCRLQQLHPIWWPGMLQNECHWTHTLQKRTLPKMQRECWLPLSHRLACRLTTSINIAAPLMFLPKNNSGTMRKGTHRTLEHGFHTSLEYQSNPHIIKETCSHSSQTGCYKMKSIQLSYTEKSTFTKECREN